MRERMFILIFISLAVLYFHPCSTLSWKLRHWKGLLMFSKNKCEDRCKFKHGYFRDDLRQYQLASRASRKIIPGKCQCMVSKELTDYITKHHSKKVAKRYALLNFFGRTKKGRDELQNLGMVFITYEQLNDIVKKRAAEEKLQAAQRAAAEQEKLLAAKKAALTKTASAASGTSSQKDSASGFGDVLTNLQYAEGVVFKSDEERDRELKEQIRKFNEMEEAKKRQL
nr:PREDICTED: uncharacterized protein LOC109029831 [Bemisia tabaci]